MGWIRETLILDGYNQAINGYREDLYNMAHKCGQLNNENADLRADIRDLEAENAKLKEKNESVLRMANECLVGLRERNNTIENYEGIIDKNNTEIENLSREKADLSREKEVVVHSLRRIGIVSTLDNTIRDNEDAARSVLNELCS